MTAYFCDASGIAKRCLHETGTAWVQALANPSAGNRRFLACISSFGPVYAEFTADGRIARVWVEFLQDTPFKDDS
jgi:hypothetical protein